MNIENNLFSTMTDSSNNCLYCDFENRGKCLAADLGKCSSDEKILAIDYTLCLFPRLNFLHGSRHCRVIMTFVTMQSQ